MDSLLFLIESKLSQLPVSERKIAEYILKEKKNVVHQGVSKIALASGTSTSAIVRLCKTLGIPGFHEMKIMLARDVYGSKYDSSHRNSDSGIHIQMEENHHTKIINSNIDSLVDLKQNLDILAIEAAADIIDNASFIHSFGVGLSNSVAFDFHHKMSRLGYTCGFAHDTQLQLIAANNLQQGMTGFIVSHSGMTDDMLKVTKTAKTNGASMIAITGNLHSHIGDYCDVVLLVPFSEPFQRLGASSTRIVQLTIIDILFTELIRRNPTRFIDSLSKTNIT